jgi:hypothetical protein
MPFRDFTDDTGRRWRAWTTFPSLHELVREKYQDGWLTFESRGERRRLAPVPLNWQGLNAVAMCLALRGAEVVRPESSISRLIAIDIGSASPSEARLSP